MHMKLRAKPFFHNCRAPAVVGPTPFRYSRATRVTLLVILGLGWRDAPGQSICCLPCFAVTRGFTLPRPQPPHRWLWACSAHLNTISRGPESKLGQGVSAQGFTNKQGSECGAQRCWQLLKWAAGSIQVHSLCPSDKPSSGFSSTIFCSPAWVRVEEGTYLKNWRCFFSLFKKKKVVKYKQLNLTILKFVTQWH